MQVSDWIWLNGELAPIDRGSPSVASLNLHLGTSVFDGLMAFWNQDHYYLHCATAHLDRFRAGAARMGLEFPWSAAEMLAGIHAVLEREPRRTQYVRPIAYRRAAELWVTGAEGRSVDVSIFTVPVPRDEDHFIACEISQVERISSLAIPGQTKVSGSYVNSHYARRSAERNGFDDGIMLDRQGRVAEASAANVFLITDGRLLTPRLNPDVFPGITRQVILDVAGEAGIEAIEDDLTPAHLAECQSAFLCSTLMEIRGVSRLGERPLMTSKDRVFDTVRSEFRRISHQ
jgi:branched-chain amino acid aminotransferase